MPDPVVHNVIPELAAFLVPIDAYKPHPDNARVGDVMFVRESLREHGQYRVAIADSNGFFALGSHMWRAAKAEGWTHLAAVQRDLDPEQARRLRITDNRSHDRGRYDQAKLLAELDEVVAAAGEDREAQIAALNAVGFDQLELAGLQRLVDDQAHQQDAAAAPDDFVDPEAGMTTDYQCPGCGYEWSGQPKPQAS